MSYSATETCQIRMSIAKDVSNELVVHEGAAPRCRQVTRPWNGWLMVAVSLGPGTVTCGRCERCTR